MDYLFLPEAACELCISASLLKVLCEQRCIHGAFRYGRIWMVPATLNRFEVETQIVYLKEQKAS